jgi:DNA polymerase sigma
VKCLRHLERTCRWGSGRRQLGVESTQLIAKARVPVLKLTLVSGTELDVSVNNDGGIKAARFLKSIVSVALSMR